MLLGPPLTALFIIIIGIIFIFSTVISIKVAWNPKLGKICKQLSFFSYIDHFASNGNTKYEFLHYRGYYCIMISLTNFSQNTEGNPAFTTSADCGIIFEKNLSFPPLSKPFKISDKSYMYFDISGKLGNEKIGLAIKNTDGEELKIDMNKFLYKKCIETDWRTAEINLKKHYKYIVSAQSRDKYLENFSIFTNSNMFPFSDEQVVYIKNVSFESNKRDN